MEEKIVKSVVPYYTIGVVWLLYSLIFPMYTIINLILATIISAIVFYLFYKIMPNKIIMVEKQIQKTGEERADKYIVSGTEILKNLRALTLDLEKTTIGNDLTKIYDITEKIIDFISKYPKKARNLDNFIEYYLPTTVTLVANYKYLIEQNQSSENIKNSKNNIEQTLPNMVKVFEKQLDSLFYDKAMDITAEISVLNDLIKSEGL
ncbi:MAG: 5-bromo-4-chloroindolyl phosphate hydrolysis family protein [Defluviitaleaceae bacterium]|nr:5-bromo-4-chloroindolyl phosphate hydrolysis family protein [Defluviitaleaceae bacterium]